MSEESNVVDTTTEDSIEMFEDTPHGEEFDDEPESFDDDWSDDDEEEEAEESETKSKNIDEKAIDKLDDQDDDEDDEDGEEKESEDDEEESEEEDEEKPPVKTIKGKHGDEGLDVPQDATFKVPVGGKSEFPTLRDLMDNYSGKKMWSQEIETAKNETRMAQHEKETVEKDKGELMDNVRHIGELFDKAMSDEVSPLAPLEYFLQLTGRSTYDYNKLMVNKMTPIIDHLNEMSEEGKSAFWLNLENEHLKNNRTAEINLAKKSESLKEHEAKLGELRESNGVSQEQFILSQRELRDIDPEFEWKPEQVVEYTVKKPMYETAQSVALEFKELIDPAGFDSLVDDLVNHMFETKDTSPETIKSILSDALDVKPNIVDDLAKKAAPKQDRTKKAAKRRKEEVQSDEIETFEDWY